MEAEVKFGRMKIGISGEKGSFSEQAANTYAQKNKIDDYEIVYLVDAENVLTSLDNGEIDKGIFPIENSNGGIVTEFVYAMAGHIFNIETMFEIDVQQCLLAKKGKNISDIKKIVSQRQALRQCRMYLKRKWENMDLEEYIDTAKSAHDLGVGIIPENCAVIAPFGCAELYGLDVLEEGIQDLKFNFTTFLVVTK